MSNFFSVDVSVPYALHTTILSVPSDNMFDFMSWSSVAIVRGQNFNGDYDVFDQTSKNHYASYYVRDIRIRGEVFTRSEFGALNMFYVVLYKTNVFKGRTIYSGHPLDGQTIRKWFFYLRPESVLSYRVLKFGDEDDVDKARSVRIDISCDKSVLLRPDEDIVVEYDYFTHSDEGDIKFRVDATAEVRFDSV